MNLPVRHLIQASILAALVCVPPAFLTSCSSGGDGGTSDGGSGSSATVASTDNAGGAATDTTTSDAAAVTNVGGAATATIKGAVVFKGVATPRKKINMASNKDCVALHTGGVPLSERLVVGENGAVANSFVWVSKGLENQTFPVPAEKVLFDQRGCKYPPHVFGVMAGQEIEVRNSDPTMHNVHIRPKRNRVVNRSQTKQGDVFIQKFRKSETKPVRIKCDVHPWMTAYAGVLDHPYFAISGDDGTFELPKIAPGTYTVSIWHESHEYGDLEATVTEQKVTIGDGETKELAPFEYSE